MPVQVKNRREEPRSRIPGFQDAEIEFTGPDGTAHKRQLIELSVSGGSFQLPERIPGLEVGTTVEGSVIRIGEFEIHVNFVIRRVTRDDGKGYECGVQLYTMNDQDRNEMAALISQLQRDADAIRGAESG
ncbi:MAG: PilZ domain-containing protein [Acidobacteria bacterium]|nr:PilZ domain-containing protein [Acidobacteriota bacterium]